MLALGLGGMAALALLLGGAPAASAAVCGGDDTDPPKLFDSAGYFFDITEASTTGPDRNDPFATFYDSGANGPADTPPGPVVNSDTYDQWGALFVGPGGDASLSNLYFSTDNNSCAYTAGGQNIIFPRVQIGALRVQRTIYVPPNGLPGARILNLITNPTRAAVTTQVQVGDTRSSDNDGDLGSDNLTGVRFSSSGDTTLTPADRWAVTSDHAGAGFAGSDVALAHVIDGPGARHRIDFATLTGVSADTGDVEDNLAWRWNLKVQPGQTIALMSVEVQQDVPAHTAAANTNARTQALAWQAAGAAQLFARLTKTQKAAVANWRTPVRCGGRRVTIAGTDGANRIKGTRRADVIFAGGGRDRVRGLGGNDRICGAKGRDRLIGGKGRDRLFGGPGRDRLRGGPGVDIQRQ